VLVFKYKILDVVVVDMVLYGFDGGLLANVEGGDAEVRQLMRSLGWMNG